jgi:hypothetical protein
VATDPQNKVHEKGTISFAAIFSNGPFSGIWAFWDYGVN